MRKVCIVIGSRANYSSIKSLMMSIKAHQQLELLTVVMASAALDRYGAVSRLIENDGFIINETIYSIIEGENPTTMAKSAGLALLELPSVFERIQPDIVVTVGDRYEMLSVAVAAAYMNITVAHTMGGEVTGTIDESIRHSITKMSHLHFAASEDAARRIHLLGELRNNIYNVGCPRIDLVKNILQTHQSTAADLNMMKGTGSNFDLENGFVLVSQHPVTTEYHLSEASMNATLRAVDEVGIPAIVLWPNSDAGSDGVSRAIRKWRETGPSIPAHFFKNLPIDQYVWLMSKTKALIGNSSSGIREGAFIGTPVVNIGTRQNLRQQGSNVVNCNHNSDQIKSAIKHQSMHGRYPSSDIYGNGSAGEKISSILASAALYSQKTISY